MKQQLNLNEIARERCEKLLSMAASILAENPSRARRYVQLANRIAMRHRIHLDAKRYCKKCFTAWVAGKSVRVRLDSRNKRALYACCECGAKKAFGYGRKEQKRQKENARFTRLAHQTVLRQAGI